METLFSLHVVSGQHVEASPLKLVGGLIGVPHHQLQGKNIQHAVATIVILPARVVIYDITMICFNRFLFLGLKRGNKWKSVIGCCIVMTKSFL